jgi:hypothetical protein
MNVIGYRSYIKKVIPIIIIVLGVLIASLGAMLYALSKEVSFLIAFLILGVIVSSFCTYLLLLAIRNNKIGPNTIIYNEESKELTLYLHDGKEKALPLSEIIEVYSSGKEKGSTVMIKTNEYIVSVRYCANPIEICEKITDLISAKEDNNG